MKSQNFCYSITFVAIFVLSALLFSGNLLAEEPRPVPGIPGLSGFKVDDTGGRISGMAVTKSGAVHFFADYSFQHQVEILYQFQGKQVSVDIDLARKSARFLGSTVSTGDAFYMHLGDKKLFEEMLYLFQMHSNQFSDLKDVVNGRALLLLARTTELLAMFDVNRKLEVSISAPIKKSWVSLCDDIGEWKTAYWDNDVQTRFQSFVVGGHGVCKGRCGAGCPWFADPAYTQDCLNHDACAGEEGEQLGVCSDEWNAASDDFLFAPDCT